MSLNNDGTGSLAETIVRAAIQAGGRYPARAIEDLREIGERQAFSGLVRHQMLTSPASVRRHLRDLQEQIARLRRTLSVTPTPVADAALVHILEGRARLLETAVIAMKDD